MKKISLILVLAALSGSILPFSLLAQGTAFTYQGQLDSSGAPVFGLYDFRFRLASDPSANSYVASPWVTNGVPVTNGLFTVALDFGSGIFNGNSYWLEVDVRTNGGGTYANLAPLQALTPAPYAVMANSASNLLGALPASQLSGAVPSANLGGTYSAAVTLNNAGNSFTGNGSGLSSLNASQLTTGTLPDARLSGNVARLNANQTFTGQNLFQNGIGIGNPAPVWGLDVLAAQAVGRFVTTNSVNGSGIELRNTITNLTGYTLGAINFNNYSNTYPGQIAYIAGDWFTPNRDHMDFRVAGSLGLSLRADPTGSGAPNIVAGSYVNFISTVGCSGNTIAGGGNVPQGNFIDANCSANFIGSGIYNLFGTNVSRSFVGAGYLNQIFANAYDDVIGGGNQNVIQGSVSDSVIAGGSSITIQGGASGCSVGGGFANTIQGGTYNSTIAGGGGQRGELKRAVRNHRRRTG